IIETLSKSKTMVFCSSPESSLKSESSSIAPISSTYSSSWRICLLIVSLFTRYLLKEMKRTNSLFIVFVSFVFFDNTDDFRTVVFPEVHDELVRMKKGEVETKPGPVFLFHHCFLSK